MPIRLPVFEALHLDKYSWIILMVLGTNHCGSVQTAATEYLFIYVIE